ncbi:MAG: hypothetical protein ABI706_19425 [Ilumatobacteraceae bacterium]
MRSTLRRVAAAVIVATATSACSGSSTASPTSASPTSTTAATSATPPRVDLIRGAVAALEVQLGSPQQYFEINATSQLVNLIVALNGGTVARPWVYLDGELSSSSGSDAHGNTFAASALDFDPDKVLSKLQAELPQSRADLFFVEGGPGGIARYSVAVTSSQGGQLVVVVGPDGTVRSVDPT